MNIEMKKCPLCGETMKEVNNEYFCAHCKKFFTLGKQNVIALPFNISTQEIYSDFKKCKSITKLYVPCKIIKGNIYLYSKIGSPIYEERLYCKKIHLSIISNDIKVNKAAYGYKIDENDIKIIKNEDIENIFVLSDRTSIYIKEEIEKYEMKRQEEVKAKADKIGYSYYTVDEIEALCNGLEVSKDIVYYPVYVVSFTKKMPNVISGYKKVSTKENNLYLAILLFIVLLIYILTLKIHSRDIRFVIRTISIILTIGFKGSLKFLLHEKISNSGYKKIKKRNY